MRDYSYGVCGCGEPINCSPKPLCNETETSPHRYIFIQQVLLQCTTEDAFQNQSPFVALPFSEKTIWEGIFAAISHQVKQDFWLESYFWVTRLVSTATTDTMKTGLLHLVLRLLQYMQSAVKFTLTQKSPPISFSWTAIKPQPLRGRKQLLVLKSIYARASLSFGWQKKKMQRCIFFGTAESSRELRAITKSAAVKHDGRLIGK